MHGKCLEKGNNKTFHNNFLQLLLQISKTSFLRFNFKN